MRSKNTVTVSMIDGSIKRITLPGASWEGREETTTGCGISAVYIGVISRRVVIEAYSQWQGSKPISYYEADAAECARLAELLPEVAAGLDSIYKPQEL